MPAWISRDSIGEDMFTAFGSCQRRVIRTVTLFGKEYDVKSAQAEGNDFLNAKIDDIYFCHPSIEVRGDILAASEKEIEEYVLSEMRVKYSTRFVEFIRDCSGKFTRKMNSESQPEKISISLGRDNPQILIGCMALGMNLKIPVSVKGNLDLERLIKADKFEKIRDSF